MKLKLFLLLLLMACGSLSAQQLSKLPKVERDRKLIEIALKVYRQDRFKHVYREFGTPIITERIYEQDNNDPKSASYGVKKGDISYKVTFPYDKSKEQMEMDFAAQVLIIDKTAKAVSIYLGTNIGKILRDKNNCDTTSNKP